MWKVDKNYSKNPSQLSYQEEKGTTDTDVVDFNNIVIE